MKKNLHLALHLFISNSFLLGNQYSPISSGLCGIKAKHLQAHLAQEVSIFLLKAFCL